MVNIRSTPYLTGHNFRNRRVTFYGIMNRQKRAWKLAEKFDALQLLKKEGISKACRQPGLWGSRCKQADSVCNE